VKKFLKFLEILTSKFFLQPVEEKFYVAET